MYLTKRNIVKILVFVFMVSFYICPLLWVLNVSLQPGDVALKKFEKWPPEISFKSYEDALNKREIWDSIKYSTRVSLISSLIGSFFAIASVYVILANIVTPCWKNCIFQTSIGLFFLPVFVISPGLKLLSKFTFLNSAVQLYYVHIIFSYVMAFILFWLIYTNDETSYFEQLLLETGSRIRAFALGVITPKIVSSLLVISFTFATVWSEFFLSNLILSTSQLKPYSVVLMRASGQYRTEFSIFAAGAMVSLLIWLFIISLALALGHLYLSRSRQKRY